MCILIRVESEYHLSMDDDTVSVIFVGSYSTDRQTASVFGHEVDDHRVSKQAPAHAHV